MMVNPRSFLDVLLEEWDPKKNRKSQKLIDYPPSSSFRPWWMCAQGHSFRMAVKARYSGSGCLTCAVSLGKRRPDLIPWWDAKKNRKSAFNVSIYDSTSYSWVCPEGHSKKASIITRMRHVPVCRVCVQDGLAALDHTASDTYNFQLIHPEIAAEWDYGMNIQGPEEFAPCSTRNVHWICPNGHPWSCTVAARTSGEHRRTCHTCKSLSYTHPQVAKEFHPTLNGKITAYDIRKSDRTTYNWKCDEGHIFSAPVNSRTREKYGMTCNKCRSIKYMYPSLFADEWAKSKNKGEDPELLMPSSNVVVWWRLPGKSRSFYQQAVSTRILRWKREVASAEVSAQVEASRAVG